MSDTSPADDVIERLRATVVLPVIRSASPDAAVDVARRCVAAGCDVIELTATTPDWLTVLETTRREFVASDQRIGVGTIRTAADARRAIDGGADFVVSPCPAPAVREAIGGALFIEGGQTVGEVLAAAAHGVAKLFPAHVGGPQFLRSMLALDPTMRIIPTGGVRLDGIAEWLVAGAWAVGVGSDLLRHPDPAAAITEARANARRS